MVSSLEFTCGGLLYTAAPFSGWYSVTEICRNLTDPSRYDLSRLVATRMGIDTRTEATLWRDLAISEVGAAVLHSFAVAGFAMTDHHTLLAQFHAWYRSEMRNRGFCPGNWKWIIPPMAAAANTACARGRGSACPLLVPACSPLLHPTSLGLVSGVRV